MPLHHGILLLLRAVSENLQHYHVILECPSLFITLALISHLLSVYTYAVHFFISNSEL